MSDLRRYPVWGVTEVSSALYSAGVHEVTNSSLGRVFNSFHIHVCGTAPLPFVCTAKIMDSAISSFSRFHP